MTATTLPTKDPAESVVLGFDFSSEAASVSITSVTASVRSSAATTPAALTLSGSAQISGTNPAIVLQRVSGGDDTTDYRLRCVVTTSAGDTLVRAAILPVRQQPLI
jgi:hypothetical protein